MKYHEIQDYGMQVLVVPLFGYSPAMISEFESQIKPDRIILCHTSSINDSAHLNAKALGYTLESSYPEVSEISVTPLACSEIPNSLGEAFSRMIRNDFEGQPNKENIAYHTLITQDSPLGYFFGLTMLSILSPISVFCHMSRTSLDISRTHPNDFSGDLDNRYSIEQVPLFDQFNEATEWFNNKPGSLRIFGLIIGWYDEDRTRYKERKWFGSSTVEDFASRMNKSEVGQSAISSQITNMRNMPEKIQLIKRNEEKKTEYRITPLGRSVGWIMGLTNQYPEIVGFEE